MSAMIRYLFFITCIVSGVLCQSQTLDWVNQLDADADGIIRSVKVDQQNNVYVLGAFEGSLDLDPGLGVFNVTSPSVANKDIFLAKYDSSGAFIWGFDIGDSAEQSANYLFIKSNGNIIISGEIEGVVDFDPSINSFTVSSKSAFGNTYVASYSNSGSFNWVRLFEYADQSGSWYTELDNSENIYLSFDVKDSVDLDPDTGVTMVYGNNYEKTFLVKLNPNGKYNWHITLGDSGFTSLRRISFENDQMYLMGRYTKSFDMDPSIGVSSISDGGNFQEKIFIGRYDTSANFNWAIWHFFDGLGGTGQIRARNNSLYYFNRLISNVDFNPGSSNGSFSISNNSFSFTNFDSSGTYDTTRIIQSNDTRYQIRKSGNSDWLFAGNIDGIVDVDINGGSYVLNPVSGKGIFVARYSSNFDLQRAFLVEGNSVDVTALDESSNNDVLLCGYFDGQTDFDPTLDTSYLNSTGSFDSFIAKFGPCISQDTTDTLYICPGDSILIGDTYRDSAGTYNDTLRAFNSCDSIVAYTLIVYPEQSFSWWGDTLDACDGDSLFFHAGNTLTNSWTWHDGSTGTSWSGVFDHLNPIDSVSVTVGDIMGCSHTGKLVIMDNTIDNFGAIVNSPQNPQASFSSVIPNEVDSFYWDFGDGTTLANVPSPNHQYTQFGSYEVCLYLFNECGMDSSCKTVEIGPVGIQSTENEQVIQIFPNPSKDGLFTLETSQMGQLNIFDAQGKLLIQRQINATQTTLDLQSYGSGVYLLELQLDNSILRRQLIVE